MKANLLLFLCLCYVELAEIVKLVKIDKKVLQRRVFSHSNLLFSKENFENHFEQMV